MNAKQLGSKLIVEIDLDEPRPSKTGKSDIVATTGGFKPTTVQVNARPVRVSLTAII